MNRHAKASSARLNSGTGSSRGLFSRAFATRGASSDAKGTGAPSHRTRSVPAGLSLSLIALVFALTAAPASADQSLFDFFGSTGSGAGQFGKKFEEVATKQVEVPAGGLAVNDATGDIYVADRVNNRIEQFDSDENFIRGWGIDVIPGGAVGTGTLTGSSKEVATVVTTSKAFIPGQEVSVSAGSGILPAGTAITEVITGVGAASKLILSKAATASGSVTLTAAAGSGNVPLNEQQKVSISATGGSFKLTLATTSPTASAQTGNIAFNAPATGAGSVKEALELLANVGPGNVEVTGSAGGPWTVEFKGTRFADTNVAQMATTGSALTGGAAAIRVETLVEGAGRFEKCTTATTCQAGTVTGIAGGMGRPNSVAIKQDTGNVYVSETGNVRVDQFDPSGTPIRAWGGNVVASGPDNKPSVQAIKVAGGSGTFVLTFSGKSTTATGTATTNGTNELTVVTSTGSGAYLIGEEISGTGIPAGTKITGVGAGTLLLSESATTSTSGVAIAANLPYNASAALVEQALNALSTIGGAFGSVSVSGTSPYQVTFGDALANTNVAEIQLNVAGIGYAVGNELPCSAGPAAGATLTYEWLRNGIAIGGATSPTYTTVAEDAGKSIQCKVKATNSEGASTMISRPPAMVAPTPTPAAPVPGSPSISGTLTPGATLTCGKGTWSGSPTFTYRWLRNGIEIATATSETYVVQAADLQTAVQCEVTGTNSSGAAAADSEFGVIRSTPSTNTGSVANAPKVTVSGGGVANVGSTLSCSNGTWAGALTPSYQWLRNGTPINTATSSTYTTVAADESTVVQCVVTAAGGGSAVSANTQISPSTFPSPPARPSTLISVTGVPSFGLPTIGLTLTCNPGTTWTPASPAATFTLQWLRNGTPIAGATESNYTTTLADADKLVQCQVTATNLNGSSVALSPANALSSSSSSVWLRVPPTATAALAFVATTQRPGAEICNAGSDVCQTAEIQTGPGVPGGAFGAASASGKAIFEGYLAVSPAGPYAGDVFVADSAQRRIQIFTPAGAFVGTFSKEALFSGPEVSGKHLCLASLGDVCGSSIFGLPEGGTGVAAVEKYGFSSGNTGGERGDPPIRFAFSPTGALYVVNQYTLQKYSPSLLVEKDFAAFQCTLKTVSAEYCTNVATDPQTGDVYVAYGIPAPGNVVQETVIARVDSEGGKPGPGGEEAAAIETALKGSEVKPINGFAIDGSIGNERSGRLYLTTSNPEQRVDVLGEPTPPDVTIDPIDPEGIGPHNATVSGTINPNGNKSHTTYRFEYVTQGGVWTTYPIPDTDVGNGTAPVEAEQTIPGLRANTEYRLRLTAFKGGRYSSPEETFTTPPTGPDVETGIAQWSGPPASGPSLTFSANVDDNNLPVHYYFEYGTDTSYGTRVPFFETGTHPGAQEAFTARATVNGLDPAGTYHYRIVARTTSGTSIGLDREVGPAAAGGRFAEMVSPVDKGVGKAGHFLFAGLHQEEFQAAESGNRMSYAYEYGTKEATGGGDLFYLGSRDPLSGWQSTQLTPPSLGTGSEGVGDVTPGRIRWQSPELSCSIVESHGAQTPDTPNFDQIQFLYRRDADGNLTRMTPAPIDLGSQSYDLGVYHFQVAGGTDNCDRVIFAVTVSGLSSLAYPLLPSIPAGHKEHVYEWESAGGPNGTLRSVDILPDGSVPPQGASYGGGTAQMNATNSPTLSRVFFSAKSTENGDSGKTAIFVRKNHTVTVDISQSQTATPNNGDSAFEMASKNGSHVFFRARTGIANNGSSVAGPSTCTTGSGAGLGCDLYDYNVDTGGLRDLTSDANPADTGGAYVIGMYGASDDGSYAYFVAKGQLVPGQGKTYAENSIKGANIYLAHNGTLSLIGTVTEGETTPVGLNQSVYVNQQGYSQSSTRVTPSGQFLLFRSQDNLTSYNSGGVAELYRYSVGSNSIVCISCRTDGQLPHGTAEQLNEQAMLPSFTGSQGATNYLQRAISDDGSRIFFNSYDKLSPDAIEGSSQDNRSAYEWHDGVVRVLAAQGQVVDSTANGSNVFIVTKEALVPQDRDFAGDVYDLRFDGGFPYFPTESCDPLTENSCQGTPPAPPAVTADPASSTFTGPVNPLVPSAKPQHTKKHHKHHKKSHKRTVRHNGGGSK